MSERWTEETRKRLEGIAALFEGTAGWTKERGVLPNFHQIASDLREMLLAIDRLTALVKECEQDHPPEPEYVAWEEAGKPDGDAATDKGCGSTARRGGRRPSEPARTHH